MSPVCNLQMGLEDEIAIGSPEKALGKDHPKVGEVLENYAALLLELGKVKKAETLETRAKAIRSQ